MTGLDLSYIPIVVFSALVCTLIRRFLAPRCRPHSFSEKKNSTYELNLFDTYVVCWSHATFTGVGSFLALRNNPLLMQDLYGKTDQFGCYIVAISMGYFIYDQFNMLSFKDWNTLSVKWFTVHHLCVILVFGHTAVTQRAVGLCMIALKMEINSIFLHARVLLKFYQLRDTNFFTFVSILNLITNITHRQIVGIQCFLWGYDFVQQNPTVLHLMILVASGIICFMNIHLLATCAKDDFLSSQKKNSKSD